MWPDTSADTTTLTETTDATDESNDCYEGPLLSYAIIFLKGMLSEARVHVPFVSFSTAYFSLNVARTPTNAIVKFEEN